MKVIDDYLHQDRVDELNNLTIEYDKVHWIGSNSESVNPLTKLVHSTKQYLSAPPLGATAWYNVRPRESYKNQFDPVYHSDIFSYNDEYPTILPEYTFLYYMHAPKSGGHLQIGGKEWSFDETFAPTPNRLLYFDACLTHRVQPYEGNRVSVAWVWWDVTPDRYEEQKIDEYNILERCWG